MLYAYTTERYNKEYLNVYGYEDDLVLQETSDDQDGPLKLLLSAIYV